MKKILMSGGSLIFAGALVFSATGAFFSDVETSSGNTFTAGSIDLLVDSQAHYAGLVCNAQGVWEDDPNVQAATTRPDLLGDPCVGTWTMTDLGPSHTFFNLGDLKPGDEGENTISLHVEDNDAYVCAAITDLEDNDNGLTEPEGDAGDVTPGPLGGGELSTEINFFAWSETDGDNIWEVGEPALFANPFFGPASDVLGDVVYPLFTPQTQVLPGDTTTYVGLAWCYGGMTVDIGTATLTCDGGPVTNVSQTDSMTADISFYVEQARNNAQFTCPSAEEIGQDDDAEIDWVESAQTGGDATEGPGDTESGSNLLVLTTINDTASRVRYSYDVNDINVSSFTGFSYDSKQVSAADAVNGNASFRLVVDLDGNLLTVGDVTDVTYEPYYNIAAHNSLNDASIVPGTWQNWAATMTDGKFWAAGVTTVLGPSEGAGGAYATNFTIQQLLDAYPSSKIVGISIGMGTWNVNQVVHVDNLIYNGNVLGFE